MLQLVTVSIAVGIAHPDVLGTLSVGFLFDDALAAQLKEITGSEIAFAMDGSMMGFYPGPRFAGLTFRLAKYASVVQWPHNATEPRDLPRFRSLTMSVGCLAPFT